MKTTMTFLFAISVAVAVAAPVVIRVTPGGMSLHEAAQRARSAKMSDPSAEVRVELAKGVHSVSSPLVVGPEDSGVIWTGAGKAVVSGGRRIEGWKDDGDGVVSAPLPRDADGVVPCFEQLWVNGRRAERSVWPKGGFLSGIEFPQSAVTNVDGTITATQSVKFADPSVAAFLGAIDGSDRPYVKLAARVKWTYGNYALAGIDAAANIVRVRSNRLTPPWALWDKTSRLRFENTRAGFSEPGDWLFDVASGRVRYRLRKGESADALVAVAPVSGLSQLVRIKGELGGRHVSGLVFSNIVFAVTVTPSNGEREKVGSFGDIPTDHVSAALPRGMVQIVGHQAAVATDGAIVAQGLRDSLFIDCRVTRTGNYAVRLEDGCVSNRIVRCTFDDLGAGGIWIGAADKCLPPIEVKRARLRNDGPRACKFNVVDDCTIRGGGKVNAEGVGVVIGHASDCTVTHCEISDLEYSGISAGWIWGYAGSICQRNEISFNKIHDIGKGSMDDFAGIYTLSTSFGTCVSNNVVFNVECSAKGYGGWGLYCDEGAEGIVMENNVTWDTTDGSFHQHYGTGCQIRNNIFAYNRREGAVKATNQNPFQHVPSQINVYGNIVLVKGAKNPFVDPRTFGVVGPWACNLWWNEDSQPVFAPNGMTFEEWKRRGLEVGGVLADPLFVDAQNHDFRLKPESPALALGFREWDLSAAGRRKQNSKKGKTR